MNQGTPEQGRQIRHRRRVTLASFIVGGLIWFVAGDYISSHFGERASTAFIMLYWLFGGCGFLIFTISYWRCPVCRHNFPRDSNGEHCAHCDTKFDA